MNVHVYMHSHSKRAKSQALLDLGAMENFMTLEYAKYLKVPIKTLKEPRKLFNVDGTINCISKTWLVWTALDSTVQLATDSQFPQPGLSLASPGQHLAMSVQLCPAQSRQGCAVSSIA